MNAVPTFFYAIAVSIMVMNVSSTTPMPDLVDMATFCPDIVLDIRYATDNNFTGKKVYSHAKCYLLRSTAEKLKEVQKHLKKFGVGLKIYDGFRFQQAQELLWQVYPDKRYVANPAKGSCHTRGCAVDVTLIKLEDGKELAMPTKFDDFTKQAHRNYMDLPQEAIANRQLLEDVMTKFGFVGLPTEWWHFDDANWEQCPLLRDLTFEELSQRIG
jgi:D-alanyl-D-alanine dipeptidase